MSTTTILAMAAPQAAHIIAWVVSETIGFATGSYGGTVNSEIILDDDGDFSVKPDGVRYALMYRDDALGWATVANGEVHVDLAGWFRAEMHDNNISQTLVDSLWAIDEEMIMRATLSE